MTIELAKVATGVDFLATQLDWVAAKLANIAAVSTETSTKLVRVNRESARA